MGAKGYRGRPPKPDARQHAIAAGLMFEPNLKFKTTHREVVDRIFAARDAVGPGDAADAFLASLDTRRLELRSAVAAIFLGFLERIRTAGSRDPGLPIGAVPPLLRGLLPSNEAERRALVEILGWLGILRPPVERFPDEWVDVSARPHAPTARSDWPNPAHSWRGADGVDDIAVRRIFAQL